MSEPATVSNAPTVSRRTLAILGRGPFGRYAAGTVVSQTGTWMQSMAQSWVMTGLTTQRDFDPEPGCRPAASVPMLVLTMYGGSRWPIVSTSAENHRG